jgi:hypothetical protein
MLNRVKGATPFERRDGLSRLGSLISVERRQTRRSISIERNSTASTRPSGPRLSGNAWRQSLKRDGEKAFCARQKISFHHTLKTRPRQPRARRNNTTFLAKILAFSTKPSVSVVLSSFFSHERSPRPSPTTFQLAERRTTSTIRGGDGGGRRRLPSTI